jgi:CMP-N-acetylneuraminate monooxygenase
MGDRARIGTRDQFGRLPARVEVGTRPFFLIEDGSRYRLLSAICPHQSGVVFQDGDRFACPIHNWQFALDGRCLTAPSRPLQSHDVVVEDDVLYVELPQAASAAVGRRGRLRPPGLSLSLHGHACLEIAWRGFSIVTDPWLDGPAMLGAWAPYPPPLMSGAALRPNVLVITHEHSDHFHPPTLRHIDPAVPVFVPAFPNGRLERQLKALGFRNVHSLRFGERTELAPGCAVTAYEPDSFWNDALVLFEVGGFRMLNVNDAGINARLAGAIDSVDLLAIQFSAGASGYPWTWAHIEDAQKEAISRRSCTGTLSLVREAARIYQAQYVLPFASHFTLWHPEHRAYARQMHRNRPADVVAALAGTSVRVLDLLPGDAWLSDGDRIERRRDQEALYAPEAIETYAQTAVSREQFAAAHPSTASLTRADLVQYFERLNDVPDIVHCEDLSVRFIASGPEGDVVVDFEVLGGRLRVLDAPLERPNLTITVPLPIAEAAIVHGTSWDEAFIGCWARFDRSPDVYHAGFWRLLQAPHFRRPLRLAQGARGEALGRTTTVADVLERYGADADRVLRRYGLYCSGCHHSTADTLEHAARQHAIPESRLEHLIAELRRAFAPA